MSIFMNTLEALEHNVCEGGLNANEHYVGAIDMSDSSLDMALTEGSEAIARTTSSTTS